MKVLVKEVVMVMVKGGCYGEERDGRIFLLYSTEKHAWMANYSLFQLVSGDNEDLLCQ